MRSWLPLASLLCLAACEDEGGPGTMCDDICDVLVQPCEYTAFPTVASCEQGCAYSKSEGADIEGYLACVQEAKCDTFAVVECERSHGI